MNERLKQARKALGLSQAKFAEQLGITAQALSLLEIGTTPITNKHIKPICAIFNVNEEWLETGNGAMFLNKDELDRFTQRFSNLSERDKSYINTLMDAMLAQQEGEEG